MIVTATLNGVSLDTPAWTVVAPGYDELFNSPALRGEDLVMPTAAGVRAYPRVVTATVVSIPLLIIGQYTMAGAVNADPWVGLLTNRDYLRNNLGLPGTSGVNANRGTVVLALDRPGALATIDADVTFLGLQGFQTIGYGEALARIDLSIPAGELS